jgi:hypothetical protein
MAPFRKRNRDELLEIIGCMAAEFQHAAEASKEDAVSQIHAVERGTLVDLDEAIHRAVNAISFMRLSQQLDEIVGIAEGRRNASRWLRRAEKRLGAGPGDG